MFIGHLFSAVLLIGEPTLWESHLQLLIDLLLTEGVPNRNHTPKTVSTVKQLPVIACNMDLVFMHQACMPRFGHGAFLVCLEALFKVNTSISNHLCLVSYTLPESLLRRPFFTLQLTANLICNY